MPNARADAREIVADCIAHEPIDGGAHSSACAVSEHSRANKRIVYLRGCDNDVLPEDFCESANFLVHAIEDLLLNVRTYSIGRLDGRHPASDVQGTATPYNPVRWVETCCYIGQENALFGGDSVCSERGLTLRACLVFA